MAPNMKRIPGRQLLIVRNRLKAETDIAKKASLKRLEANLLFELGLRDEAVAVAASLADQDSAGGSAYAFLADILAGMGRWRLAEENFVIAHRMCVESNRSLKAFSLAAGPLFLLAEAREDYERCIDIAPSELLRNRARRLSGAERVDAPKPDCSPWKELFLVEQVHSGGNFSILNDILHDWKAGEAEWRWRILFEGAVLCSEAGSSMKQWKMYLGQTGGRVLDPRYPHERKLLKMLLLSKNSSILR
jgi:tetratricopeptide (TPR) repeat protein